MFKLKECISISWNEDRHVLGIRLKSDAKSSHIIDHVICDNEEQSFSERLKFVYDKLFKNQDQLIILGGHISSAVCFEQEIPPLSKNDTQQYLHYELSRQIPYPVSELKWCWRNISAEENSSKTEQKVRILAMFDKEWNELLNEIIISGIKIDSIVYPFMAITPLLQDRDIILPGIDKDFFFTPSSEIEDEFMKKIPIAGLEENESAAGETATADYFKEKYRDQGIENFEKFSPALILAEYCLSREYLKDKKLNITVPKELLPKRFKSLKIIAILFFVVFIILSGTYFVRERIDAANILDELTEEKASLTAAINRINVEYSKNQKNDKIIDAITDSIPDTIDPVSYLDALSKAIPGNIWMTSFASNKDKVNLTLQTTGDAGNVITELNKSQLFRTEDVRTRKTSDGTQYIYLTLEPRKM